MAKTKKLSGSLTSKSELEILRKVVEVSASDLDLAAILKRIVELVDDVTRADSVMVYLFDERRHVLTLMASKVPHKKVIGRISLKVGEGITGWVAEKNKTVIISENASQDARFKNFDILPEDRYEAFLSVPMIFRGRVTGVINVQHKAGHQYEPSTVSMLEVLAKQVGGVVEHARLFEESRTKAKQLDQLMKVSSTITSQKYLDEILNLIVVVTAEMMDSKICSIMLLDEKKGSELILKATQSMSEEYKRKPNLKVDSSIAGQVVTSRQPVMIADVRQEKKYYYRQLAVKEGLSSMLAVPMIVKDKVVGVINAYTKEPHNFTNDEIEVLQMVANQAAVAVENTKLVAETIKAREALENRKVVERAKGVLMRLNDLSEEAAYRLIHKKSMDTCRTMREIADSIILMDEFQKK